jgi:hypothetical protein
VEIPYPLRINRSAVIKEIIANNGGYFIPVPKVKEMLTVDGFDITVGGRPIRSTKFRVHLMELMKLSKNEHKILFGYIGYDGLSGLDLYFKLAAGELDKSKLDIKIYSLYDKVGHGSTYGVRISTLRDDKNYANYYGGVFKYVKTGDVLGCDEWTHAPTDLQRAFNTIDEFERKGYEVIYIPAAECFANTHMEYYWCSFLNQVGIEIDGMTKKGLQMCELDLHDGTKIDARLTTYQIEVLTELFEHRMKMLPTALIGQGEHKANRRFIGIL